MLTLFLSLFLAFWVGGVAPIPPQEPPKLVIDSVQHDLGIVKKSVGGSHTFRFRNEGASELQIESVAPS
jgi:hypothetical protein